MKTPDESELWASPDCQKVQQLLEDQLLEKCSPDEKQQMFFDEHLHGCRDCAEFVALTRRMQSAALAPVSEESQRAAAKAASTFFDRRHRMRNRVTALAFATAAAAALLLYLLYPSAAPVPEEATPEIALQLVDGNLFLDQQVQIPGSLHALGREITATESGARLTVGDLATLALGPGTKIVPTVLTPDTALVRLERGMLAVQIQPGSSSRPRFTLQTALAAVTVKGTRFAVEVGDGWVKVDVVEGVIQVQPKGQQAMDAFVLEEGNSWNLNLDSSAIRPLESARGQHILAMFGQAEPPAHAQTTPTTRVTVQIEQVPPDSPADQPSPATASQREQAQAKTSPKAEKLPELNTLLDQVRACRIARNWDCAAAGYLQVAQGYPQSPAATNVLVALAEIQLRHLGQPNQALSNFGHYLARRPKGNLADEASYGICRAHRTLGSTPNEQRALRNFVARYPSSMYVSQARDRLEELTATNK